MIGWDGMGWNGTEWARGEMGWDRMELDAMGWYGICGMQREGIAWDDVG